MSAPLLPWRDDLLLAAAVVGADIVLFLPGVWLVAGQLSRELLLFSGAFVLTHLLRAGAQIVALRLLERPVARHAVLRRFGIAMVAGLVMEAVFSSQAHVHAMRLGLIDDIATGRALGMWQVLLTAALLAWFREARLRQRASAQRLQRIQQAQIDGRRALVDAQLRAMQARVDPDQLFGALDAVERLFGPEPARADALFDALVSYLRATVPSVDSAASTLARELDLAASSVRMHALSTGRDTALSVDVAAPLRELAFPPGVLLPLLGGVLGAGGLAISAQRSAGTGIELRLDAARAPDAVRLRRARESLQALYGAGAALHCEARPGGASQVRIELHHEPA